MSLSPVRTFRTAVIGAAAAATSAALTLLVCAPAGVAAAAPDAIQYVALGDSYAAGVGAGTPQGACGRTDGAYPVLWSTTVSGAVTLNSVACSGARTADGPGQLASVTAGTDLVTLTIGANDLHPFDTLMACTTDLNSVACTGAQSAAQAALATTIPQAITAMLAALKVAAPNALIAVVGYPVPFASPSPCPTVPVPSEVRDIANNAMTTLDAILAAAATNANDARIKYVDVNGVFAGHQLCTGSPWLIGAEGIADRTTLHPTLAGQQGYLAAITGRVGTVAEVNAWLTARNATSPAPTATTQAGSTLPVTGTRLGTIVGVAIIAVSAGVALVMLARRRRVRMTVD